jgi:DNA-binding transcriptional ArsR family regulator
MPSATSSRDLPHPAVEDILLEGVLHALADPQRLAIVRRLASADADLSCSDFELPVTKSTSTHHFRVLREAGLLRQTYRGAAKLNRLRRQELEQLFPGLLDGVLAAAYAEDARRG